MDMDTSPSVHPHHIMQEEPHIYEFSNRISLHLDLVRSGLMLGYIYPGELASVVTEQTRCKLRQQNYSHYLQHYVLD